MSGNIYLHTGLHFDLDYYKEHLISLELLNIFQPNFSKLKNTFVAFNSYKKVLVAFDLISRSHDLIWLQVNYLHAILDTDDNKKKCSCFFSFFFFFFCLGFFFCTLSHQAYHFKELRAHNWQQLKIDFLTQTLCSFHKIYRAERVDLSLSECCKKYGNFYGYVKLQTFALFC